MRSTTFHAARLPSDAEVAGDVDGRELAGRAGRGHVHAQAGDAQALGHVDAQRRRGGVEQQHVGARPGCGQDGLGGLPDAVLRRLHALLEPGLGPTLGPVVGQAEAQRVLGQRAEPQPGPGHRPGEGVVGGDRDVEAGRPQADTQAGVGGDVAHPAGRDDEGLRHAVRLPRRTGQPADRRAGGRAGRRRLGAGWGRLRGHAQHLAHGGDRGGGPVLGPHPLADRTGGLGVRRVGHRRPHGGGQPLDRELLGRDRVGRHAQRHQALAPERLVQPHRYGHRRQPGLQPGRHDPRPRGVDHRGHVGEQPVMRAPRRWTACRRRWPPARPIRPG